MEKIDLRYVSQETRETIRRQVVTLLQKGKKHSDIADDLCISKHAVDKISKDYKAKGSACIKEKIRGRKFGEKRQLVKDKYDITITLRNMSEYLKRCGMTCQRPTKKAYFQDNVKLNTFMHETYPDIVKKAQKEDAIIMWGDETGINNHE